MEAAIKEVEGTEGTEYEGMDEEQIERAMFAKAVNDDPDLDEKLEVPEVPTDEEEPEEKEEPEEEVEEEGEESAEGEQEEKRPTGMEWLDTIPEKDREVAQQFIERQGQTIARLEQRVKSHLGQLQPTQRAVAQMRQKVRQLQDELSKQQPKTNPAIEKYRQDTLRWIDQEYKDFPEEAAKLKTQLVESLDGVSKVLQPAPSPRQYDGPPGPDRHEEVQHLSTAYSDWGERRYSPEFDQWLKQQQPEIQGLIHSPFASDNIALLDAFTNDHPDWTPPQKPEDFYSVRQAQYSPLFRGWAEGEGYNPTTLAGLSDYERDRILTQFKTDLGSVLQENEPEKKTASKVAQRRKQQLENRDPGSRRQGIRPGHTPDLSTEEGQRAYFDQLIAADPDLR